MNNKGSRDRTVASIREVTRAPSPWTTSLILPSKYWFNNNIHWICTYLVCRTSGHRPVVFIYFLSAISLVQKIGGSSVSNITDLLLKAISGVPTSVWSMYVLRLPASTSPHSKQHVVGMHVVTKVTIISFFNIYNILANQIKLHIVSIKWLDKLI